jgi:hypothetical protein
MRRIPLTLLLPLGLLALPPAATGQIGQDASRVRLDAPLFTRGGAPACTTTDALAGYYSALRGGIGSSVSVYGCLLLQEGAAAELVGRDNEAYRIRVVHPGTGDIYPVELWTTVDGLRNAVGREPAPPLGREPARR